MMNRPFSIGISVPSASRRADIFASDPVSSDVLSAEFVYTQAGGRSQNAACSRASSSTTWPAWSLVIG